MTDQIELPEADELDTAHAEENSGYQVSLYLVPAEENDGEVPRVASHSGYGNIGTPMLAFNGRWAPIASYGPQVVGASVREMLEEISDVLVAYAKRYEGTEWDGSNHKGMWDLDDLYEGEGFFASQVAFPLVDSWNKNEHLISHYWHASDYFGPAGIDWEELCDEAGIDPKRAFKEELYVLAEIIEANIQDQQEESVTGTAYYAEQCAKDYIYEYERCA